MTQRTKNEARIKEIEARVRAGISVEWQQVVYLLTQIREQEKVIEGLERKTEVSYSLEYVKMCAKGEARLARREQCIEDCEAVCCECREGWKVGRRAGFSQWYHPELSIGVVCSASAIRTANADLLQPLPGSQVAGGG